MQVQCPTSHLCCTSFCSASLWNFIAHCLGLSEHGACQFHAPALVTWIFLCPQSHYATIPITPSKRRTHPDSAIHLACHSTIHCGKTCSVRHGNWRENGVGNIKSPVVLLLLQTNSLAFHSLRGRE